MFVKGENLCNTCIRHSYFEECTGSNYVEKTEVVIACDEYKRNNYIKEDYEEED